MSNPIPRRQIEKALQEKGFLQEERDHTVYCFYYNGKKTRARTKISRGSGYKDYDDNLFKLMRTQLCLESIKQVRELFECPLNEDGYIQLLVAGEHLPLEDGTTTV